MNKGSLSLMKDIATQKVDPQQQAPAKPERIPERVEEQPQDGIDDEAVDGVPMYRRKGIVIPLFVVLIVAAGGLWYWYTNLRGFDSSNESRAQITGRLSGFFRPIILVVASGKKLKFPPGRGLISGVPLMTN